MKACPHCATPIEEGDATCARCAPRFAPPRRTSRAFRIAFLTLALGVVLAATLPGMRGETVRPASCEPESWADWHQAMRSACLTPAYVCHNMTSSKLLEDPQLAAEYRAGLAAGDPAPLSGLDELVARMRSAYGCGDAPAPPQADPFQGAAPRLPPGHPPVPATPELPAFGRRGAVEI
jgi:predicted nucleic acid-binding Zn ribbon protein